MLGPVHRDVAGTLSKLAAVYREDARYDPAEEVYRRLLSIREQTLGPGHPDLAASLDDYAELLREFNRAAEAEKQEARAAAIRAKYEQANPHE